jgi:hypothetical protein
VISLGGFGTSGYAPAFRLWPSPSPAQRVGPA